MSGLEKIYEEIGKVNRDFIDRMRTIDMEDANFNAIVSLDCFCLSSEAMMNFSLDKLSRIFESYL